MGSYKLVMEKCSLADAVSNGYGELQGLRDEMREWAENMEGGNLGQTTKCQDVAAVADTLDEFADNEPDVPETLGAIVVDVPLQHNKRKGRGDSRAVRCGNAVAYLRAVMDYCQEYLEDESNPQEARDAAEELADNLDNPVSEADGIEFPGMY